MDDMEMIPGYINPIISDNEDLPLDALNRQLEVGMRVRMGAMPHDPLPVPEGTMGTITEIKHFDPPLSATYSVWEDGKPVKTGIPAEDIEVKVWVDWDNGRSLSLLLPKDDFEIIGDADYDDT